MDRDALHAFLAQPHDAIITTNRVGKGSQLNPVWFVWDGEVFLFSTQKASSREWQMGPAPHRCHPWRFSSFHTLRLACLPK